MPLHPGVNLPPTQHGILKEKFQRFVTFAFLIFMVQMLVVL